MSFSDLKLNKQLLDALKDLNYETPSPIQEKAIPLILAGHDVMGIAQTGTGKTAAYLLPILMKIKFAQGDNPRALILAPTRELVIQIEETIRHLAKYTDLRFAAIYGGLGPTTQIELVRQGLDILVATPGRLMDIYFKEVLILKELNTLVLDEADKMMDMGFMPQINQILEIIPTKRQNLLFSATMPEKVIRLSEDFLEFPTVIEISPQATAATTVKQGLYLLPNFKTKINLLQLLLEDADTFKRVIVFVRTKKNADNIYKFLERKLKEDQIKVIHANKGQNTRINAMQAFKNGEVRVLVATDVVARGIDVSLVSHVINFDVPMIYEDYIHRIGRTGRAEESGEAFSLVTKADLYHITKIEALMNQKIPEIPLPENLQITPTPREEEQAMLREIDYQKKKENPDYQGAFHEKKISKTKKTSAKPNAPKKTNSFLKRSQKNNHKKKRP
ncbi:MAG: DEAD/DEAH box helicase [Microscillaceae bacterium]|nr:DEAD/DEAH box helicase [Microscillaceae bacterium]